METAEEIAAKYIKLANDDLKRSSSQDLKRGPIVGSGPLIRALRYLRTADVSLQCVLALREEAPENARRMLQAALANIEEAQRQLCPITPEPKP